MKRGLLHIAICVSLWGASMASCAQNLVVDVEGGRIEGVIDQEGIVVYKGIPYAAPPVGELRWKHPQPVRPWQGVKACKQFGDASFQGGQIEGSFYWKEFYQDGNPEMSEDCLYLNIWTPASGKKNAHLPVMVWIHGGAFQNGFGHEIEFDGDAYAKKGIILVTLNYRLGMCGFLSHPLLTAENSGKGSGNYGLFDQLAALKWIKRNIEVFGGNPNNVTVFGQSAGAGSVQALISSPLAKGYVQRAIIQSGGGLGGIISTKSLQEAETMGKAMWDASGYDTLEQMRTCPVEHFQEVMMNYMKVQKTFNGMPYSPCVDGELLESSVYDVALQNKELDIPYMIGYTSEDIAPDQMKQAAVNWSLLLERQGRCPAYVYCFSRDLPGEDMSAPKGGFGDMKGAFHSSELWYMFGTLDKCWRPMEKADYELSERMVSYWTNFDEAYKLADEVITKGADEGIMLEPVYGDIFSSFQSTDLLFYPYTMNNQQTVAGYRYDWSAGAGNTLRKIAALYPEDKRYAWAFDAENMISSYRMNKYQMNDNVDKVPGNSLYMLRLSEMYLVKAEAAIRKPAPDFTAAREALRPITDRAGFAADFVDNVADKDMLMTVFYQKYLELFGENFEDWFDMIRYNKLDGTDWVALGYVNSWTRLALPIPRSAIAGNDLLVQNP